MKLKMIILASLFMLLLAHPGPAEVVKVGLEPLPPLITKDGNGYSIDMLKAIEKISDIKFEITIMPYTRAKINLKKNIYDLIGHTPHKLETKNFYAYAQELDWCIDVPIDTFSLEKHFLEQNILRSGITIGTPRGNEDFLSNKYNISIDHFHPGKLDNLLVMMYKGRVDLILFERASVINKIHELGEKNAKYNYKLDLQNIHYKNIDIIPASFGVRNNKKGSDLKKKMDELIKKTDYKKIFSRALKYWSLPDKGIVKSK